MTQNFPKGVSRRTRRRRRLNKNSPPPKKFVGVTPNAAAAGKF